MITTGVITGKFFDKDGVTLYNVDISIFRDPTSDRGQSIVSATCCATPGQYEAYNDGDKVYISFVNNSISHPVILGKIYQNLEEASVTKPASYFKVNSLEVTEDAVLPANTKIGNLDLSNLEVTALGLNNVLSSIDGINSSIDDINDRLDNVHQLYEHNITVTHSSSGDALKIIINFKFVNTVGTAYTNNKRDLCNYLYNAGFKRGGSYPYTYKNLCPASGMRAYNSTSSNATREISIVDGVYGSGGINDTHNLGVHYITAITYSNSTSVATMSTSLSTSIVDIDITGSDVTDTVVTL